MLDVLAVWAAGRGPDPSFTAVQDESQPQEDMSKLAVGSAEEQAKSRFGAIASSHFRR